MRLGASVRFVLRGMAARRMRIGLTTLGVALGVALVVGMSLINSSLYSSFTSLTSAIYGKAQLVVVPSAAGSTLEPRAMALAERAPGISHVDGAVYFPARRLTSIGHPGHSTVSGRLTVIGVSRTGARDAVGLAGVSVTQGRPPQNGAEIALEQGWAKRNRLRLGDELRLAAPAGIIRLRLVGTFILPAVADVLGQAFAAVPLSTARAAAERPAGFDELTIVLKRGARPGPARRFLVAGLGNTAKVVSPQERASGLASQLTLLRVIVTVLTAIGLVVAAFLTRSCFTLTTHERQREFGILRAIGTPGSTVATLVVFEAMFIGVAASAAGLCLGWLIARVLIALAPASGYRLAGASLHQATLWIAVGGGPIAAMTGAIGPALRSSRDEPLTSLAARGGEATAPRRRWAGVGSAAIVIGLATCYAVAAPAEQISAAGLAIAIVAILLTFTGAAVVMPSAVGPLVALMRRPLGRWGRPAGFVAAGSLTSRPRRSATTASVVMLGVTLTVVAGSLISSVIGSVSDQLERTNTKGFIVQPRGFDELSIQPQQAFSDRLREEIAALPGAAVVSPQRIILGSGVLGSQATLLTAVDPGSYTRVQRLSLDQGSSRAAVNGLQRGEVIIGDGLAASQRLRAGQTIVIRGSRGAFGTRIVAVAHDLLNNGDEMTMSLTLMRRAFGVTSDSLLEVDASSQAWLPRLRRAVDALLARSYPQLQTISPHELSAQISTRLKAFGAGANLLLLLIATISIVAIITTLTLNIVERTREIGVLRAVGLSAEQLRASVRLESVSLSLFGALCGVVLGTALGLAVVAGVARSIPSLAYSPPTPAIEAALLWAVLLGVLAAMPALRRASRINITAAIAYE